MDKETKLYCWVCDKRTEHRDVQRVPRDDPQGWGGMLLSARCKVCGAIKSGTD